jgi:hypothetical protein
MRLARDVAHFAYRFTGNPSDTARSSSDNSATTVHSAPTVSANTTEDIAEYSRCSDSKTATSSRWQFWKLPDSFDEDVDVKMAMVSPSIVAVARCCNPF